MKRVRAMCGVNVMTVAVVQSCDFIWATSSLDSPAVVNGSGVKQVTGTLRCSEQTAGAGTHCVGEIETSSASALCSAMSCSARSMRH